MEATAVVVERNEAREQLKHSQRENERLREALRESDDMLRGWVAPLADEPGYRGMALSTDTILQEHATALAPHEESG